jgi:hypothetical protein
MNKLFLLSLTLLLTHINACPSPTSSNIPEDCQVDGGTCADNLYINNGYCSICPSRYDHDVSQTPDGCVNFNTRSCITSTTGENQNVCGCPAATNGYLANNCRVDQYQGTCSNGDSYLALTPTESPSSETIQPHCGRCPPLYLQDYDSVIPEDCKKHKDANCAAGLTPITNENGHVICQNPCLPDNNKPDGCYANSVSECASGIISLNEHGLNVCGCPEWTASISGIPDTCFNANTLSVSQLSAVGADKLKQAYQAIPGSCSVLKGNGDQCDGPQECESGYCENVCLLPPISCENDNDCESGYCHDATTFSLDLHHSQKSCQPQCLRTCGVNIVPIVSYTEAPYGCIGSDPNYMFNEANEDSNDIKCDSNNFYDWNGGVTCYCPV